MELAKFRTFKSIQSSALVKIWTLKSIPGNHLSKFELWNVNEVGKFWKPGAFVIARSFRSILGTTFVKKLRVMNLKTVAHLSTFLMQSLYKVGHLSSRIFARLGVSNLYVVRYFSKVADRGLYEVGHLQKFRVIHLNKQRHLSKFLVTKL